jgi:hypothetical protein
MPYTNPMIRAMPSRKQIPSHVNPVSRKVKEVPGNDRMAGAPRFAARRA